MTVCSYVDQTTGMRKRNSGPKLARVMSLSITRRRQSPSSEGSVLHGLVTVGRVPGTPCLTPDAGVVAGIVAPHGSIGACHSSRHAPPAPSGETADRSRFSVRRPCGMRRDFDHPPKEFGGDQGSCATSEGMRTGNSCSRYAFPTSPHRRVSREYGSKQPFYDQRFPQCHRLFGVNLQDPDRRPADQHGAFPAEMVCPFVAAGIVQPRQLLGRPVQTSNV